MRSIVYSDHVMKEKFVSFTIPFTFANYFKRSDLYFKRWKQEILIINKRVFV